MERRGICQKCHSHRWLLWIALAIMLSETLTSLTVLVVRMTWQKWKHPRKSNDVKDEVPLIHLVPLSWWIGGLVITTIVGTIIPSLLFDLLFYIPLVVRLVIRSQEGIVLAALVAVLAVRALGETDLNPVSGVGKLSQLVFALIAPGNIVANLIAGAIAEASAQQAGDLLQDLKTGHLLAAAPRAQFWGQMIGNLSLDLTKGSAFSILVTVGAYELYTTAYQVPSPQLPVPMAGVWIDMARVLRDGKTADGVLPVALVAAMVTIGLTILGEVRPKWHQWLPSGVALAIGMYLEPHWVLPRVVGAVGQAVWYWRSPTSHSLGMIAVAAGLVLGEGITSIPAALLRAFGVGVLSCWGCAPGLCGGC